MALCIDNNQSVSIFRVLVVEDFEPFRRFICSKLCGNPELQVIGEVSDGMEAVQKAGELKPDLILLDIGLPALHGIEAARHIRTLSPESKIIFVSQESSSDVVREAISVGARGYVVKTRAASDLLPALQSVCEGKLFVSGGIT
jgi:DNA-binding NarL/FixJ family response regulator